MVVGYRDNVRDLYELIFEFSSSCLFFLGVPRGRGVGFDLEIVMGLFHFD